jgi:hypothetical protein
MGRDSRSNTAASPLGQDQQWIHHVSEAISYLDIQNQLTGTGKVPGADKKRVECTQE